jgi:hypothetical protein
MKHARSDYDRIQDPAGKIGTDEPVFIARAKDKHFIPLLEWYRTLVAEDSAGDKRMLPLLDAHIKLASDWQFEHGCKTPDLPITEDVPASEAGEAQNGTD